jgi:hypothetical protein
MTMTTPEIAVAPAVAQRYLDWGPIIAGAVGAAAISFLLLTFGTAVGLSVTAPWPHRGVSLSLAAWAVLWWTVLVQIGSFAAGGYLAGRMRSTGINLTTEDSQFRDGVHGFLVWAIGVLIGAAVLAGTAAGVVKTATQSASTVAAGASAGSLSSKAAELATAPTDYAVDLLLRPTPARTSANNVTSSGAGASSSSMPRSTEPELREEAARIFSASIRNREFAQRDRDYLVQVVMARTGLPEAEAQQRVDMAMNEARDLELKARQQADKARKAAVIAGFIAAASLLLSAAAACVAAGVGGRHRDEGTAVRFFGHPRFW